MYTRTPNIACRAFNRKVFPRTNLSLPESQFFHMFGTGRCLIFLKLLISWGAAEPFVWIHPGLGDTAVIWCLLTACKERGRMGHPILCVIEA
jgi:hypothetical protein